MFSIIQWIDPKKVVINTGEKNTNQELRLKNKEEIKNCLIKE